LVSDFLETKRKEIAARLRELEPLIDEYRQLEAAQAALAGLPSGSRAPSTRRGSAARRCGSRHRELRGVAGVRAVAERARFRRSSW
jgi:hypothetical protein